MPELADAVGMKCRETTEDAAVILFHRRFDSALSMMEKYVERRGEMKGFVKSIGSRDFYDHNIPDYIKSCRNSFQEVRAAITFTSLPPGHISYNDLELKIGNRFRIKKAIKIYSRDR